ncbi:hypothetical protein, partial [Variovorax paradoxus]|uniref:hypothetical protein n=1 Tax=Variovorax paradoxus TaxID=34073 RepID=UPI001E3B3CA2
LGGARGASSQKGCSSQQGNKRFHGASAVKTAATAPDTRRPEFRGTQGNLLCNRLVVVSYQCICNQMHVA